MELRYEEVDRARQIFERYVVCHPTVEAWVKYAKFEMKNGEVALCRACYERAVEELADEKGKVGCCGPSGGRIFSLEGATRVRPTGGCMGRGFRGGGRAV